MNISEDKIAEVRDRADILAIIGKRVELRRIGRSHIGLCPFHNERSPSFNVIPDRGFYHCFGCQASGDVFKFIMETEHQPFPIVVRQLAKEVGVDIPEVEEDPAEKKARERREWLYRVNDYVNEFFVHQLWNARDAAHARAYVEKRQLTKETALTFALGYAPRRADDLVQYLKHKNVPVDAAIELGVLGKRDTDAERPPRAQNDSNDLYLRFRDRVMFPIHDDRDRIAGFGGRVLEADAKAAKYLNSPESLIFKKSRLLYGYSKAKSAIARKGGSWLCEGYLDVIALHQAGCDQAVAPLGTAVTDDHLPLLRRVSTKVKTVFDGDAAGLRATRRSAELLLAHGFTVHVVNLPDGDDPDTFVLREGSDTMRERADKAPPAVQFFIDRAAANMVPSVEGRVAVASDLAPLLGKISSQLERDLYVRDAAQKLGIDEQALRRFFGRKPNETAAPIARAAQPAPAAVVVAPVRPAKTPPPDVVELDYVLRLLQHRSAWEALPLIVPFLAHDGLKRVAEICAQDADNLDYETMLELLAGRTDLVSRLAGALAEDRSFQLTEDDRQRLIADVTRGLEYYCRRRALPNAATSPEEEIELMRKRVALVRARGPKSKR